MADPIVGRMDNGGSADREWTDTAAAAKLLEISPKTVRSYIEKGLLEGKTEDDGSKRRWYVSVDSLHDLRERRSAKEDDTESTNVSSVENNAEAIIEAIQNATMRLSEESARVATEAIQNISVRLSEESALAAELRVRLELAERTEATLREALASEREKANKERERTDQAQLEIQRVRKEAENAHQTSAELLEERKRAQEQVGRLREELEAEQIKAQNQIRQLQERLKTEQAKAASQYKDMLNELEDERSRGFFRTLFGR